MSKLVSKTCSSLLILVSVLTIKTTSAGLSIAPTPSKPDQYEAPSPEYYSLAPSTVTPVPAPKSEYKEVLSPEYPPSSPSPPNYTNESLAPNPGSEYKEVLSPEYPPSSPSPPSYTNESLAPAPKSEYKEVLSPEYPPSSPSPPNYTNESLAPNPGSDDYATIDSPTPAPSVLVLPDDLPLSNNEASQAPPDASIIATPPPHSSVLPSNYSAEYEADAFVPEQDADRSRKKATGVVFGAIVGVCVVGLIGFAYKKRKDKKRRDYLSLAKKDEI